MTAAAVKNLGKGLVALRSMSYAAGGERFWHPDSIVGIHSPLHTAVLSADTYAALVESAQQKLDGVGLVGGAP